LFSRTRTNANCGTGTWKWNNKKKEDDRLELNIVTKEYLKADANTLAIMVAYFIHKC